MPVVPSMELMINSDQKISDVSMLQNNKASHVVRESVLLILQWDGCPYYFETVQWKGDLDMTSC